MWLSSTEGPTMFSKFRLSRLGIASRRACKPFRRAPQLPASGDEGDLSDEQITLGYAGIIGGVTMSAIGMILGGIPPSKLMKGIKPQGKPCTRDA